MYTYSARCNVSIWRHFIWEAYCQDVGCLISDKKCLKCIILRCNSFILLGNRSWRTFSSVSQPTRIVTQCQQIENSKLKESTTTFDSTRTVWQWYIKLSWFMYQSATPATLGIGSQHSEFGRWLYYRRILVTNTSCIISTINQACTVYYWMTEIRNMLDMVYL